MENATKALIIAGSILIAIMLITVGIVLVNSGKGVTESGITAMEMQKVSTFNSQFVAYGGIKKGIELKDLVSLVRASNATDPEHQVSLMDATKSGFIFKATTNYKVTLYYADETSLKNFNTIKSEEGYIYRIIINYAS